MAQDPGKTRASRYELQNGTIIDTINKAIENLKKNPKLANSTLANNEIDRLTRTKQNLIKCVQTRYRESQRIVSDRTTQDEYFSTDYHRNAYQSGLLALMENNYKGLSIEKINQLQQAYFKTGKQENLSIGRYTQSPSSNAIDFLSGKKMFNLTSIVKSSIALTALTGLAKIKGFSAIGWAMSSLWKLYPPIAVLAGVAGVVGLAILAGKVFRPEIKKLLESREIRKTLAEAFDEATIDSFDINKEKGKADEQNKITQNNAELKDLHYGFGKKVKSVEDLIDLKNRLGKASSEINDPNDARKVICIDFGTIVKDNKSTIGNMFKADAKKFVFDTDRANINALRDKYKDFLSEAEMDSVEKSMGIVKEDFSQSFRAVKNSNIQSKEFEAFRNRYLYAKELLTVEINNLPNNLSLATTEINILIQDSKTIGENLSEKDAEKLQNLCQNMTKMLIELYNEVSNGKNPKNIDEIAQNHGLDALDFNNYVKNYKYEKVLTDEEKQKQAEEQKRQEEEKQERQAEQEANLERQKKLLLLYHDFDVSSIEELIALKNEIGNSTLNYGVKGSISFDEAIKKNKTAIKNMFKADAENFRYDTDRTNIAVLRDKYKDFLSEAEMDAVAQELGITKGDNFSMSVKNTDDVRSHDAFQSFKTAYNSAIEDMKNGKDPAIITGWIQNLDDISKSIEFTYKPQTKTKKNGKPNKTENINKDKDKSEKLQTLCKNMVEMLKEIRKQFEKDKDMDKAKKAIAEQHGLDANELDNLLK